MARRKGHAEVPENEERWLLTYADMLTLLFALFMVLFSISSVNISKYQVLQRSLKAAFSGAILSGGHAILRTGSQSTAAHNPATAEIPSIVPLTPTQAARSNSSTSSASGGGATVHNMTSAQVAAALTSMSKAVSEQDEFAQLKSKLDGYAKAHGLGNAVQTAITRRGLVVTVLTDKLLFDSGSATLQPAGQPLMAEIVQLLNVDKTHPIIVEGHTDNLPISTAEFPSNWELSTARATSVVRYLIAHGIGAGRMGAAGYAALDPVASNSTAAGRARNRRVDIVFERLNPLPPS
jgi:chemotaxis protein MotB